jgi:large subunit ribosomal protein L4e
VCLQERRAVAKAEKLEKMRKGEPSVVKKSAEQKAVGKAFYKSLLVDSEYQGEDYDQFDKWLGTVDAE